MKKASFFSRITGSDDEGDDEYPVVPQSVRSAFQGSGEERHSRIAVKKDEWSEEPSGELSVDVYQTPDSIVIKAFIAGVQPNSVDISLTREMLTISGTRQDEKEVEEDNYFQRELPYRARTFNFISRFLFIFGNRIMRMPCFSLASAMSTSTSSGRRIVRENAPQ